MRPGLRRSPGRATSAPQLRDVVMTDLVRLGLVLVGCAVAVVAAGVTLGLVGAVLTKRHE